MSDHSAGIKSGSKLILSADIPMQINKRYAIHRYASWAVEMRNMGLPRSTKGGVNFEMMDVRELRIGNLVLSYGTNGNPNDFIEIVVNVQHIETCARKPEWFKGIPITAEWLERLGFSCGEVRVLHYTYKFIGPIALGRKYVDGEVEFVGNYEYVHELQNVIYALTSQELTIKQ